MSKRTKTGDVRVWLFCKKHKKVFYHDYTPFSISRSLVIVPCFCEYTSLKQISAKEAKIKMRTLKAR